ncbi:Cof-type HAD-IIB family hydrolase [Sporolactobacillus spathodeae]|uniref:Cof subfamily protein (Haloacid dehalogenase superfamily) n=1 Tax=Sporolactobacillus spathodeae TaxID=1465502 RepID=A0ABS2Q678_9BACL|nr:Cof-type HAD-IIB family hydrolase [Sporolactobacillus spathodeae]MBM7657166.1 Cof subfamily protein (haloacid dehalogenase superfamily) [Sporolactobacillus spathodeae]
MIKLIATDLDGTLLNKNHQIGWENLKALRYARSKGVTLAIASGRAFFDIQHLIDEVDIEAHIIGTNGATIHTREGQLLGADYLNREEALEIISELTAKAYYIGVTTEKNIFVPSEGVSWLNEELARLGKHEDRAVGFQEAIKRDFYRFFDSVDEIKDKGGEIRKIIVFSFDDQKLADARAIYERQHRYSIVSSGAGNFEIMARNVSKGNALDHLANYLGIPLENVMAIGDNYNDLSMFAVAGLSVAMGNANSDIKEKCDRVTGDCQDDGVAQAIYEALGVRDQTSDRH